MKAVLKTEKDVLEISRELEKKDSIFYRAEGSFQGNFKSPLDILDKFKVDELGYVLVSTFAEEYYGWARNTRTYCFVGTKTKTVVCSGTKQSLKFILPIFGIDENSRTLHLETTN